MGGWICRGWISRSWGAPIFSPEFPKNLLYRVLGSLDGTSGRPKNAKSSHDRSNPHSRPSETHSDKRFSNVPSKFEVSPCEVSPSKAFCI